MTVNIMPTLRAFNWLSHGWLCLGSNIGAWIALSLLFFIGLIILLTIPQIGIFLMVTGLPILSAGLLQAANKSFQKTSPEVEDIGYGFKDKGILLRLLILGMLMTAYLYLVATMTTPQSTILYDSLYFPEENQFLTMELLLAITAEAGPLIIWLQLLLLMAAPACFGYATTLVALGQTGPFHAVIASLQAFLLNIAPLSILMLISLMLVGIASFAWGLGFIILLPILVGAHFASFKDIFCQEQVSQEPDEEEYINVVDSS